MTPQAILPAFLLATASALSFSAYAATEADKTQAAEGQAAQPAAKKVKPHSHLEEQLGIAQHMSSVVTGEEKSDNLRADKDRSKHFHPRDGK